MVVETTVQTKRELLIEVDERLSGAFTFALKPLLDTLFVDGKVRGYKLTDLRPVEGLVLAQEGTLAE